MNPHPFGLRSAYPLFIVLATVCGIATVIPGARRAGLPLWRLLAAEAVIAWAGLTGALLYNLAESGSLQQFGWRAYVESGMRYPGGIIAIVLSLPLVARLVRPSGLTLRATADVVAPGAAIAMAVMRGGCFMMGCCYGDPSSVPWALSYSPTSQAARDHVEQGWIEPGAWSLPVHPLHLYLALASLTVGVILLWYRRYKRYDGELALLYVALHEGLKGGLETMRGAPPWQSVLHLQLVAYALSAAAIIVLVLRARGRLIRWFPPLPAHASG